MKKSQLLLTNLFLLFLACKKEAPDKITFNLLFPSDLTGIENFLQCKRDSLTFKDTGFLQIRNENNYPIYLETYQYHNRTFLIANVRKFRKFQGDYIFDGKTVFYPPLKVDTLFQFQTKIYPFSFYIPEKHDTSIFLVEPMLISEGFEDQPIHSPRKLFNRKRPFVIYKTINGFSWDITQEFMDEIKKQD